MKLQEFLAKQEKLNRKAVEIIRQKNHDYADEGNMFSNFELVAQIAKMPVEKVFLMFLSVKIIRLGEVSGKGEAVNESVNDTLLDLRNYCDLFRIWRER